MKWYDTRYIRGGYLLLIKSKLLCMLLFIILAVGMVTTGCGNDVTPPLEEPLQDEEEAAPEQPTKPDEEKAALYFANADADQLVKEIREIKASGAETKKAILEELIEGPQNPELVRTIPEDVKVLDVTVEDGIAAVNFSEELRSSHWGGSTGEILTIYSIVNTLAELPDVEQVEFLIEGQEIETLMGHMDLSGAIHPDWDLTVPVT